MGTNTAQCSVLFIDNKEMDGPSLYLIHRAFCDRKEFLLRQWLDNRQWLQDN